MKESLAHRSKEDSLEVRIKSALPFLKDSEAYGGSTFYDANIDALDVYVDSKHIALGSSMLGREHGGHRLR